MKIQRKAKVKDENMEMTKRMRQDEMYSLEQAEGLEQGSGHISNCNRKGDTQNCTKRRGSLFCFFFFSFSKGKASKLSTLPFIHMV